MPEISTPPLKCLLAIATSATPASLAFVQCPGPHCLAVHEASEQGGESLLLAVAQWVGQWGVPDYLVLDVGPGAFTGLRIGLGLAQGLALAWGRRILPVSSAQILASCIQLACPDKPVISLRDARLGAVYLGEHPSRSLLAASFGEVTELSAKEALERVRLKCGHSEPWSLVVDWGLEPLLQSLCEQGLSQDDPAAAFEATASRSANQALPLLRARPGAWQLAQLACQKLDAGASCLAPSKVSPFYVRNDVAMDLAAQRAYRRARAL